MFSQCLNNTNSGSQQVIKQADNWTVLFSVSLSRPRTPGQPRQDERDEDRGEQVDCVVV